MINWQQTKIRESQYHQSIAFDHIKRLVFHERKGRKLLLDDHRWLTEFISCSYLGLDQDDRVKQAAMRNVPQLGVSFPAARTRAVTRSEVILESLLREIFCGAFCTIFQNVHQIHLGYLPLLSSGEMPSFPLTAAGPLFVLDRTAHASMQINRGLMLQFGPVVLADFSDLAAVEAVFGEAAAKAKRTPIAVADSIGSMGGALPVMSLLEIANRHNGYVYLDDAHGTSVFGANGCGYALREMEYELRRRAIIVCSLAKAFGAGGGGVLALPTEADEQAVRKFCSTYIFGGPPALPVIDAAIASAHIHLSPELAVLQQRLQENIALFDSLSATFRIINAGSESPIRGVCIGDESQGIAAAARLRESGFATTLAMYPTVRKGESMLRIALGATHTMSQIMGLCEQLHAA